MFFKRCSALQKALEKHQTLFCGWTQQHQKNAGVEECIFQKGNVTITFQEDLREHIVNLFVYHPCKRIGKVVYRQLHHGELDVDLTWLKSALKELGSKSNIEQREVDLFIRFLQLVNIL